MKTLFTLMTSLMALTTLPGGQLEAHCQIPCGIYHDDLVMHEMEECLETMNKCVAEITANLMDSPLARNQMVRWVNNKDDQSDRFANYVSEYFLKQRIKPEDANLNAKLASAHQMLVLSMKVKQTVDPKVVTSLSDQLKHFQGLMFPTPPAGTVPPTTPAHN